MLNITISFIVGWFLGKIHTGIRLIKMDSATFNAFRVKRLKAKTAFQKLKGM